MENVKKGDFVEIKFSGYANGNLFDSNIEEDLKKIHPEANAGEMIIAVGQGMVVPGLDKEIEKKEIGKEYEIKISAREGFGERKKELVKTIPLRIFREQKIEPYPGLILSMDGMIAKVITISGARVLTDFNGPLAGKEINYKIKIIRKINDEKEKCSSLFRFFLKFVPEFELGEEITVRGPKALEAFVTAFNDKFKEIIGKKMKFEIKEEKKKEKDTEKAKTDKDTRNKKP